MNLFKQKNVAVRLLKKIMCSIATLSVLVHPTFALSNDAGSSKELEVPHGFNFAQQRRVTLDLMLSQTNVLAVRVYGLNFEGMDKDESKSELPSLLSISKLEYGTSLYKIIEVPIQYTHVVIDYGQDTVEPVLIPQDNLLVLTD